MQTCDNGKRDTLYYIFDSFLLTIWPTLPQILSFIGYLHFIGFMNNILDLLEPLYKYIIFLKQLYFTNVQLQPLQEAWVWEDPRLQ